MKISIITPEEFIMCEAKYSGACHDEWRCSVDPIFRKDIMNSLEFILPNVYLIRRVDKTGKKLTPTVKDEEATPISFIEIATRPDLYIPLLEEKYDLNNTNIIAYHCSTCDIILVKDGTHRLTKWAVDKTNKEIEIYLVSSHDWSLAFIDMHNFCKCHKKERTKSAPYSIIIF